MSKLTTILSFKPTLTHSQAEMFYRTKFLVLCICAYILNSCSHYAHPKTKQELAAYVNNDSNGLIKSIKSGQYLINVVQQPKGLAPSCQNCNDYWYFIVKIGKDGNNKNEAFFDARAFPESVETFAFRMDNYIRLVTPIDTVAPADYIFQRTFGLDGKGIFLFVFPKNKIELVKEFTFLIKKNQLIKTDTKFTFLSEDIKQAQSFPSL